MRLKDDEKRAALIRSTIKLVNEIGFAASSVSKIANEANVSPSTLYVYFENKEDLLVSTYVDIKLDISEAMLKGFDNSRPIRDVFQTVWNNVFEFVSAHPQEYAFVEQFGSSPYVSLVNREELEAHFEPIMAALNRGIEQKILKDVSMEIMAEFIFYPVARLAVHQPGCTGSGSTRATSRHSAVSRSSSTRRATSAAA